MDTLMALVSVLAAVAPAAVRLGTAVLYATLGETLSERAGVVNLGTEGCMLIGALGGYALSAETGNPWVGVLAGAAAGALLSAVHAVMVLHLGANQLATGLVVLFLGLGVTSLFGGAYGEGAHTHFRPLDPYPIPLLSKIPFLGELLFQHDPLTYGSIGAAVGMWWLFYRSRWGLLLRAAGERAEVLDAYGHSARRIRYIAIIAGGALAGVGGAQLSVAYTKVWHENMTAGRGFVAVALVIFASWHPLRAVAGAYLYGAALALSPVLQARGVSLNQYLLDALPYLVTLIALVLFSRWRPHAAPEALQRVFDMTPAR
jgi:ABC-type uncharacterized transport system permease subunit